MNAEAPGENKDAKFEHCNIPGKTLDRGPAGYNQDEEAGLA